MDTEANVTEYLTIAGAAAELNICTATVRRYIADGALPAVQLGKPGSAIRISRRALDEWLSTSTEGTTS